MYCCKLRVAYQAARLCANIVVVCLNSDQLLNLIVMQSKIGLSALILSCAINVFPLYLFVFAPSEFVRMEIKSGFTFT